MAFYRLVWPAEVLKTQGHDIVIVRPDNRNGAFSGELRGDDLVSVNIPRDADVMVFQRVTHKHIAQAISLIRERGVAVVIDMDDDLTCVHPSNPAFNYLHPRGGYPDHSWKNATQACMDATIVTTATPRLLDCYGPGRVFDNYVPARYLATYHQDSDLIGWPGSVHSHPDDLQAMGPAVSQLLREGFKFGVVGNIDGIHNAWGISPDIQINATGVVPIELWPDAVANLGIGVAPLADTRFNASKSWLKVAEMAAVGVPTIASPRAEYSRLHRMGVGWLAKDGGDWKKKIRLLATNPDARAELSARGQEVMRGMTIEENAWRLWEIWTEALKMERTKALGAFSRR